MLSGVAVRHVWTLFVFVLIISANFLGQLFPCKFQAFLTNNVFLKHFFAYLTLVFFVVNATDEYRQGPFVKLMHDSFLLYIIFLFMCKTNIYFFVATILCMSFLYIISLYEQRVNEKDQSSIQKNQIQTVKRSLYIFIASIICIGFLMYFGEKKDEYKDKFDVLSFFFTEYSCRNDSVQTLRSSVKKSLNGWTAFVRSSHK